MLKRLMIPLLTLGLLSACLLMAFIPVKKAVFMPFKGSKMTQELFAECAAAHDWALAQIRADFDIPQEAWDISIQAINDGIKSDDLFSVLPQKKVNFNEPWIIQRSKEIMTEYGMNPNRVTVVPVTKEGSNGEAIQDLDENGKVVHRLEINVKWFSKYPQDMQEAFIRHEIMHLINYDPLEASYIMGLLESLGHNLQSIAAHPAIVRYNQQRELRADLLGSSGSMPVAQALCQHYTNFAQKPEEKMQQWLSHPSHAVRAQQLAHLVTNMNVQNTVLA